MLGFVGQMRIRKFLKRLFLHSRKTPYYGFFYLGERTFIFVDGHKTGLGAILAQGDSLETAKPVDIKSRCKCEAEQYNYSQLDLEGMALDYALRRFRAYLVGAPKPVIIVTDHQPLLGLFRGRRKGSIWTETIKMRHQNIQYKLVYSKGEDNSSDYISRHAQQWKKQAKSVKNESQEVTNLLYMLHLSPMIEALGITDIAKATREDPVLSELIKMLKDGKSFIPKNNKLLSSFKQIYNEITYVPNGTLIMQDRIILPSSLHDKAICLAHMGTKWTALKT